MRFSVDFLYNPIFIVSVLIVCSVIIKILVINFLIIIKREYKTLYIKFKSHSIAFSYPGRDIAVS